MKNYLPLKLFYYYSLLCLSSLLQAQSLQQPINISTYAIPFGAQKLKVADMNNDQKKDLIVMSNAQETDFAVYYGNGNGTFGLPQSYQKELNFVNFDVADLNHDSYMDLILSSYWFNGFKVYFGDKDRQFIFRDSYNMGGHATGVSCYDIDNDGSQDVIGITSGSGSPVTLNVFKGNQSGNLQSSGKYPSLLSGNLNTYVIDKNGDKLSDVLVSTRSWVALFYQQINGEFLLKYWPTDMGSVTIGDVNNDKLPDMVLGYTSFDSEQAGDSILIRFGSADTLFSAKPIKLTTSGLRPGAMLLADLNNDKLPELIINQLNTSGEATDSLYIFRGKGNEGFELNTIYKLAETIKTFMVADLKNDSFPEIILTSEKTLMIMHNSGEILSSDNSPKLTQANIYPNPVRDWLYLDLPDAITHIRITDIYGKLHYASTYAIASPTKIQLPASGVYVVQGFQNERLLFAKKIIKL